MVATSGFFLVLRPIHILAGALWFGSAFMFSVFIGPSAAKVGPAAGPLLHVAIKERKASKWIARMAMIAVTAGWIMWLYHAWDAGFSAWWDLTEAKVLLLGGVLATIAMLEGILGVGHNVEKMVDLGDQLAATAGPPSPEEGAEMQRLGAAIARHSKRDLVILAVAVFCMATARVW